ncbi:hypothetical protein A2Z67_00920 [Candidatus Woesebacteria bacterium RBG_13_36_22]|uniref:NTP pyrophosphohydrolase MazG-like domain-containing protein n=1 Tax=Candidatus Woesebacteria bacterium RBG_13_36_22 TaxID=1802478 RepID=A0A1F7WZS8_9BACT|nr:MAG: hypothetical protein A2Z67_00920 [Candidatus Woesebacteria bacterium RBG_13_36_22]
MTFDEYQKFSRGTAVYPEIGNNFVYPVLGLCGESGEVAEKIKKVLRDKFGKINKRDKIEIEKELGDVLWYLSNICSELSLSFDSVARKNLRKLLSRKKRNKLRGKGDNR